MSKSPLRKIGCPASFCRVFNPPISAPQPLMTDPELTKTSPGGIRPFIWIPIVAILAVACLFAFIKRSERGNYSDSSKVAGASAQSGSAQAVAPRLNALVDQGANAGIRSVGDIRSIGTRASLGQATPLENRIALEDRITEALNHGSTSARISILDEVAVQLAQRDTARALKLVNQLLSNPRTTNAAEGFVRKMSSELARFDPTQAARWSESLPEPLQTTALETTANVWINSDIEGAARWVATLADPNLRNSLTRRLGDEFQQAPSTPAAVAWAQNLAHSKDGLTHVGAISRIWARDDVAAASDWAFSLQERGARATASLGIASTLATGDLNAARDWLQKLPSDEMFRNDVIGILAYELDGKTQGAGLELARSFDHRYAKEREGQPTPP